MTIIDWLQTWYQEECDGTWEHTYGIRIDTLDNPGWHVQIDLAQTSYAKLIARQINVENSETDWLRCSIEEELFQGYGDPGKLEDILKVFKGWLDLRESDPPRP